MFCRVRFHHRLELTSHIFLTGFMGSGKSTLGKKLATLLKSPFIDLDATIETGEKQSIPNIFEKWGEAHFRTLESKHLREIVQTQQPSVISLGGGTVCSADNLNLVKRSGRLIYIDLPAATLKSRLIGSKTIRPLLQKLNGEELLAYIEATLEQRKLYYDQAHIKVNGLNLTAPYLLDILSASLKENNN